MNNNYHLFICVVLVLMPQIIRAQTKAIEKAKPIQIKCTSISRSHDSLSISIELKNISDLPVLVASKPRLRNGKYHYYVSVSKSDPEMMEMSSQVFTEPVPTPYADSAAVVLQSLLPGEQFVETMGLSFPLKETIPPKGSVETTDPKQSTHDISYGVEIKAEQIKKVKIIFGYFDASPELIRYLRMKPVGWVVSGRDLVKTKMKPDRQSIFHLQDLSSLILELENPSCNR